MISPDDLQDIVDDGEILFERLVAQAKKFNKNVAMTAFVNVTISLFQHIKVPKEDFLKIFADSWDAHAEAERKAKLDEP